MLNSEKQQSVSWTRGMETVSMSTQELGDYANRINEGISQVDQPGFTAFFEALINTSTGGGAVFVAGNGGSFATANHFVTDLNKRSGSSKLRAFALGANQSLLTMIGNDLGFEEIFSDELSRLGSENDLLILLSASGNSNNLIHAVKAARKLKMKVVGLTGFDGGQLALLADISVHVPTKKGEYALVEDAHSIICHFISVKLRDLKFE